LSFQRNIANNSSIASGYAEKRCKGSTFFLYARKKHRFFSNPDEKQAENHRNFPAEKRAKKSLHIKRKNKSREMLKNSVKMGVSKIVKNVKFYLLKFYFT